MCVVQMGLKGHMARRSWGKQKHLPNYVSKLIHVRIAERELGVLGEKSSDHWGKFMVDQVPHAKVGINLSARVGS
jgi:hypothetical protein